MKVSAESSLNRAAPLVSSTTSKEQKIIYKVYMIYGLYSVSSYNLTYQIKNSTNSWLTVTRNLGLSCPYIRWPKKILGSVTKIS